MREAPENTRAAFDRALSGPLDGIELDVQLTRDGVPVLHHDRTLARVGGGRKRIADHSYSMLRQKDWGGWFSEAFAGEKILSLEEALQRYGTRTRLLIEIKSRTRDRVGGRSAELTKRVLDLLEDNIPEEKRSNIFVLSFDPEVLALARRQSPGWRYVLNLSGPRPGLDAHTSQFLAARCLAVRKLDRAFVEETRGAGQLVMTYSCNVPAQVRKAVGLGADVVMSDRPGWLARHLQRGGNDS
ncbi:MAG: glycerophosphodiester phosphodiesterase [Candidatus Krumholzibacteriia bacterium]